MGDTLASTSAVAGRTPHACNVCAGVACQRDLVRTDRSGERGKQPLAVGGRDPFRYVLRAGQREQRAAVAFVEGVQQDARGAASHGDLEDRIPVRAVGPGIGVRREHHRRPGTRESSGQQMRVRQPLMAAHARGKA